MFPYKKFFFRLAYAAVAVPSAVLVNAAAVHFTSTRASAAQAQVSVVRVVSNLALRVDLKEATLSVLVNGTKSREYALSVPVGAPAAPTGIYSVRRLSVTPLPGSGVAPEGKLASSQVPGQVIRIPFQEVGCYIQSGGVSGKLADPSSHGCLRLSPEDASDLAIVLMNAAGVPESEMGLFSSSIEGSRTVVLPAAVMLTIS